MELNFARLDRPKPVPLTLQGTAHLGIRQTDKVEGVCVTRQGN